MAVRRYSSRVKRLDLAIVAGVGGALLTLTAVAPAVASQSDSGDPSVRELINPLVGQQQPKPAPAPAPAPAQPAPAPAQPAPAPAQAPGPAQQDTYEEGSMEMMAQGL